MEKDHDFIWGSYTEGLRRHGASNCSWFTIFRHPVARLGKLSRGCARVKKTVKPGDVWEGVDTTRFSTPWTSLVWLYCCDPLKLPPYLYHGSLISYAIHNHDIIRLRNRMVHRCGLHHHPILSRWDTNVRCKVVYCFFFSFGDITVRFVLREPGRYWKRGTGSHIPI